MPQRIANKLNVYWYGVCNTVDIFKDTPGNTEVNEQEQDEAKIQEDEWFSEKSSIKAASPFTNVFLNIQNATKQEISILLYPIFNTILIISIICKNFLCLTSLFGMAFYTKIWKIQMK